jgi:hypothetical protein
MAVSEVSISSNALVLLGGQPISSFTDDSTESQIAALLYKTTYESMLTETQWHFATRYTQLARHVEVPEADWSYKFQLPSDCLYVVEASVDNYEIYERNLYANIREVGINYVYAPKEINLPPFFIKALEYNLASQFAIPLTGNTTRADFYTQKYMFWLKKARFADASQRPASFIRSAPYISVRR